MPDLARRPWALWLIGGVALAGLVYSALGWGMAGSFAVADPGRLRHWRHIALLYFASGAVSAAVVVAAAIALIRHGRRRSDSGSPAV